MFLDIIFWCCAGDLSQSEVCLWILLVLVWAKRRGLSVKRPLCLCICKAARGYKPVFVWIKMKGFRSRIFILQTCQKSDLRCKRGGSWEKRVEEKNWRFEKLRLSDFWIKKVKLNSRCICVKMKGSCPESLISLIIKYTYRIIQQETETDLSLWWQFDTGKDPLSMSSKKQKINWQL